ncbi:MAG: hypothetical protein P8Y67_12100 [Alphaproteobacteria bacterium]
MKINVTLAILLSGLGLAACTYERDGPPVSHYQEFQTRAPKGNTVYVCHAYGCQKQTPLKFGQKQIKAIAKLMRKTKKADTAAEERRAVAYAIGWMETYAGTKVGTKNDRPGMDYDGSGDPSQQDCVDEATNTTSYLTILEKNKLLKHHTVGRPFSRGNVLLGGVSNWPHWTAVLWETSNKKKWAVDSWIGPNGENPAIVEADKWYLKNLDALPKPQT